MLLAFLPGFEQKQQISADNYRDGLESFLQKNIDLKHKQLDLKHCQLDLGESFF
jgi:hypothetical protein